MIFGSFLPPMLIRYVSRHPALVRLERFCSAMLLGMLMRMVLLAHK